jgi:hypothetical protein
MYDVHTTARGHFCRKSGAPSQRIAPSCASSSMTFASSTMLTSLLLQALLLGAAASAAPARNQHRPTVNVAPNLPLQPRANTAAPVNGSLEGDTAAATAATPTTEIPTVHGALRRQTVDFSSLSAALARRRAEIRAPGAQGALYRCGELLWSAAVGVKDNVSRRPVDATTLFVLASTTKVCRVQGGERGRGGEVRGSRRVLVQVPDVCHLVWQLWRWHVNEHVPRFAP